VTVTAPFLKAQKCEGVIGLKGILVGIPSRQPYRVPAVDKSGPKGTVNSFTAPNEINGRAGPTPVVGSSEVRRLGERVRELERLLGRKTMEMEIKNRACSLRRR
jgi:hypothetical protein